jgi:predicted RNA-binding Zn-ribbon protein involved in translation (DUF1610 family)
MKCPVCGNVMKAGKIGARTGGLYWLPNEEEIGFILSNNIIKKHNGIVLVGCNELRVSRSAYVCEECRKIIMDY